MTGRWLETEADTKVKSKPQTCSTCIFIMRIMTVSHFSLSLTFLNAFISFLHVQTVSINLFILNITFPFLGGIYFSPYSFYFLTFPEVISLLLLCDIYFASSLYAFHPPLFFFFSLLCYQEDHNGTKTKVIQHVSAAKQTLWVTKPQRQQSWQITATAAARCFVKKGQRTLSVFCSIFQLCAYSITVRLESTTNLLLSMLCRLCSIYSHTACFSDQPMYFLLLLFFTALYSFSVTVLCVFSTEFNKDLHYC